MRNAPTAALTRFVKTAAFAGTARLSVSAVKAPARSALYCATAAVNTVRTAQKYVRIAASARIAPSSVSFAVFARTALNFATTAVPVKTV